MDSEVEQKLPKHHYIPVLYLKQWVKADGRFTEFSRPPGRTVVEPRGTGARGTGFQRGLYRLKGVSGEAAEMVERKFMAQVDNLAKDALDILLGNVRAEWTLKTRSAWSRFVNGFLFRVPERVAEVQRALEDHWLEKYDERLPEYNSLKAPGDPEFIDYIIHQTERGTLHAVMNQIDSERLGKRFNKMHWFTLDTTLARRPLFTSDRPIIMTNGLGYPASHLVMPISPARLFAATNTVEEENKLRSIPQRELAKMANRHVVRRAQKYVWNCDDQELDFVRKHMSAEAQIDREFFLRPPKPGSDHPKEVLSST
ncbi:MAG TPA: DUF4238 domain-containing protein [Bradyrhizobium sp.]|nr:DUF4238 domain-containing protein [Bradyrhizobium sp.]